jgi:sarcosine oxidase subunit delta
MKIIHCPVNGPRPLQEFYFGGQFRPLPDSPEEGSLTDSQWADYVFNRDGAPGIQKEWWYHTPSGTWFIAERDIVKDSFVQTYLFEERDEHA